MLIFGPDAPEQEEDGADLSGPEEEAPEQDVGSGSFDLDAQAGFDLAGFAADLLDLDAQVGAGLLDFPGEIAADLLDFLGQF